MQQDLFGNKLEEGQKVIYDTDKFATKIGKVLYITGNSILIQADGYKQQIFNKNSYKFPVVVLGIIIKECEE